MTGVMRGFLVFACIFAVHFFSEQQVLCSQGLTRSAGLSCGNFVEHLFHHLNVSQVGSSLVNDVIDCAMACLRVVTCFSYNVGTQPDIDNRILCELLASDKYNFSEKFQANPHLHHYAIHNKCSEGPCVNGGKCIALYSHGDFKCKCLLGFEGKKCEKDVDECKENKNNCSGNAACQNTFGSFNCTRTKGFHGNGVKCDDLRLSDSEILREHSDYKTKLIEYLVPVQVSGKQWKLCFRASEHQYRATAFHTACDNKGPTVTLIRVGIHVFGGYTDKSWDGNAVPQECSNYTVLSEADRAISYDSRYGVLKCDKSGFTSGWYRFSGSAGSQMPDYCVPEYSCGTHAAGWLNGRHPTVEEGVVSRQVCFSWVKNGCWQSTSTTVRNCSGFYVYHFDPTPSCQYRYCGNQNGSFSSAPSPSPSAVRASSSASVAGYISSNAAFLFSLKNHVNQPYKMLADVFPQYATSSSDNYGPTFGGGHDLHVADNCNANTGSYTNLGNTYKAPNGYVYGTSEIQALLAGSYSFKCDEYEVFYQV